MIEGENTKKKEGEIRMLKHENEKKKTMRKNEKKEKKTKIIWKF